MTSCLFAFSSSSSCVGAYEDTPHILTRPCMYLSRQHTASMDSPMNTRKSLFGSRRGANPTYSPTTSQSSTPSAPYYAPPPINGIFLCRIKLSNGSQSEFTPYSVQCVVEQSGGCVLHFNTNDGANLTETRIFNIPPTRKVHMSWLGAM